MNRKLLFVFCLSLLSIFSRPYAVKANHSAGGELLYEWVSGSTYRFYLKFYRDCNGVNENAIAYMCYFNSCNPADANNVPLMKMTTLPDGSPNGREVTLNCPGIQTRCAYGYPFVAPPGLLPGYQEWWYTGTVTLPSKCDSWTFYVSVSTRNGAVNIGTSNDNLYIEATLNNKDIAQFSSPVMTVKPIPYMCINQKISYSSGPVDPDGDLMSFEFIAPRTSPGPGTGTGFMPGVYLCSGSYVGNDLIYNPPFNLANPFSTTGNIFAFDSRTGLMTFTPNNIGIDAVAMRINKWRNGVKLGSVMRDIQFNVITCTNAPINLRIDTTQLLNAFYENGIIETCVKRPFEFKYIVTSTTNGAVLAVTDNHNKSTKGASVSYSLYGTDSVTGSFSWTPSDTGLFMLSVTVRDSTCSLAGATVPQSYLVPIHVRGFAVNRYVKKCGSAPLNLVATGDDQIQWDVLPGGSPISSIACPTCKTTAVTPTMNTTYVCSYTTSKLCATGDTIYVTVVNSDISITPASSLVLCSSDSIVLNALATGSKPLINLQCGLTTTPAGTIIDTIIVMPALPSLPTLQGPQTTTNQASTPFNGNYVTAHHQYLLKAADMLASGMQSGSLKSISFRLSGNPANAQYTNLVISLKCTTDPLSANTFMTGVVPVYTAVGTITLPTTTGYVVFNFNTPYNWDISQDLLVDICYANLDTMPLANTYYYNTNYAATRYVYNANGNVCNGAAAITPPMSLINELPLMRFEYYPAPEYPDFSYRWGSTMDNVFVPSDTGANTTIYANKPTRVYVSTVGRYGCMPSDTLDIYVSNHTYKICNDTIVCLGASASLWIHDLSVDSNTQHTWQWYEGENMNSTSSLSCSNCPNPIAIPDSTTRYWVVVTDSVNCGDTLQVLVTVNPIPDVHIVNNDTTIGFGSQTQLLAVGADRYVWFPASSLNNPNIPNPIAKPTDSTFYSVVGVKGICQGTDTVQIRVDMEGNVFVPSAFTPNGDGKNDVFRVANMTFQKLMDFKVYNRWGQEVYSTTDAKQGWDGTWKGVSQDLGTYYYLIKVSFPTGELRTYQGNVTLIR